MQMQMQMKVRVPIDEVLAAVAEKREPPQDERQWIVVEIVDGKMSWTTHNIALDDAFKFLELCALDARDEMRHAARNHTPAR